MRLFVAIGLPPEVRQTLNRLQGSIAGARWVADSDLHLTLCFIGDVGAGDVFEIEAELAGVNFPTFDIILCELGTFDKYLSPSSCCASTSPELASCVNLNCCHIWYPRSGR